MGRKESDGGQNLRSMEIGSIFLSEGKGGNGELLDDDKRKEPPRKHFCPRYQ